MTWTRKQINYTIFQRIAMHFVKNGPLPKHVAFIMDGNRRFAEKQLLKKSDGHLHGFSKLSEALQWCRDFGIVEVTVFAFSIDNFQRSPEEVSFLMELAEEKLQELLDHKDELCSDGICIRVIGNLKMLPEKVQRLSAQIMLETKNCLREVLNICMAYASRDEIRYALEVIRSGVQDGILDQNDVSPKLISKCLYTRLSRPLDLFIRTSGEVRISDFLTWQAAENGAIHKFVDNYWPLFTFWDFILALLHYQVSLVGISSLLDFSILQPVSHQSTNRAIADRQKPHDQPSNDDHTSNPRITKFLNRLDSQYWHQLQVLASGDK